MHSYYKMLYFRDKLGLVRTVQRSMRRLIVFHFGSIIYASLALNIFTTIYQKLWGPVDRRYGRLRIMSNNSKANPGSGEGPRL